MDIPSENQRLKDVINFFCNGNELQFSKEINIAQPRINRLFSIDPRSGKYPLVSFEIIQAAINKFININAEWLITGHGEMLKKDQPVIAKESKANYNNKSIPLLPLEAFAGLGESSVVGVDFDTIEERYDVPLFYNIRVDFMINVRGSSMYPKYSSGDVVACRMVDNLLFVQWNKIYVLDTISQGIIMKRLKKSKIEGNIICKSDNHEYEEFEVPMSDIRNIALVVGSIRLE